MLICRSIPNENTVFDLAKRQHSRSRKSPISAPSEAKALLASDSIFVANSAVVVALDRDSRFVEPKGFSNDSAQSLGIDSLT
jgi:hypothetical protein